jgi:hypothetical protein
MKTAGKFFGPMSAVQLPIGAPFVQNARGRYSVTPSGSAYVEIYSDSNGEPCGPEDCCYSYPRAVMRSRQEIEEILRAELESARLRRQSAKEEFTRVCNEIPSGLPHPDGTLRILNASREKAAAQEAFAAALQRFNAFILKGEIPDDLGGKRLGG